MPPPNSRTLSHAPQLEKLRRNSSAKRAVTREATAEEEAARKAASAAGLERPTVMARAKTVSGTQSL